MLKQVRKIKPNYRSVTGFVTYKGESIAYESTLERDFLLYHAALPNVIDITPQPISIPFIKNGRTYEYTPDYFVQFKLNDKFKPRSLMVEVKPKEEWQVNWRDWSDKWKAAIAYCNENDFRFSIYDEDRIRHHALDNVNFLSKYKNLAVDRKEVNAILQQIEMRGETTVEVILELFFKGDIYRPHGKRVLWHLMSHNLIGFDIWEDITSEKLEIYHVDF
ncbi:TnsA endonuclease N-terminal domain-containing protein [Moraxella sp. RCAD0137]|uniref:TnsA endonuclease N-terminal domain-containing protein n=1 Tax=Moraxella sp. RCAD0137 TaxID=1775913 RepID=UPI000C9F5BA8|nr:TnsA endonuclease N-terminal domain-containing protein [Moraxella sp. RCAD0137]PNP96951.1 hypothetical protein AZ602_08615 [Moraxella sp. RCAD0137]